MDGAIERVGGLPTRGTTVEGGDDDNGSAE